MKIVVISDTHIPLHANSIPKTILDSFRGADVIVHAGDLVELSVLDTLKTICNNIKAVCGNMDSPEVKKHLPEKQIFSIGRVRIGVTHGRGAPTHLIETVSNLFKNEKVDIIIFGHSHSPFNEKRHGILYFNPGSLTDTYFSSYNSFGIIEIDGEIKAEIIKI